MTSISIDYLYQQALLWTGDMLNCNKIRLSDVAFEIRTSSPSIYHKAFIVSNYISCTRYIEDLKTLCGDILNLDNSYFYRNDLLKTLSHALYGITRKNYSGVGEFEDFKREIPEKILSELREVDGFICESIRIELKKQEFI